MKKHGMFPAEMKSLMKNEARGFCDDGTGSFFRMKYKLFITMWFHLLIIALSELDFVSWLKGRICFIPGKTCLASRQRGVWPCTAQKGHAVWLSFMPETAAALP